MNTRPIPKGPVEVELGRIFREARQAAGISLNAMRDALGCSINTIRWHEAGARSLRADEIIRAAGIIGCPPENLLRAAEDPEAEGAEDAEADSTAA